MGGIDRLALEIQTNKSMNEVQNAHSEYRRTAQSHTRFRRGEAVKFIDDFHTVWRKAVCTPAAAGFHRAGRVRGHPAHLPARAAVAWWSVLTFAVVAGALWARFIAQPGMRPGARAMASSDSAPSWRPSWGRHRCGLLPMLVQVEGPGQPHLPRPHRRPDFLRGAHRPRVAHGPGVDGRAVRAATGDDVLKHSKFLSCITYRPLSDGNKAAFASLSSTWAARLSATQP